MGRVVKRFFIKCFLIKKNTLQPEVFETRLSQLTVDGVCNLLRKMDELNPTALPDYFSVIKEHNINGKVLLHCDLDDLKEVIMIFFCFNFLNN